MQDTKPGKKETIAAGKRVCVECSAPECLIQVESPAFKLIELNPSDKFRFFGLCLGHNPQQQIVQCLVG